MMKELYITPEQEQKMMKELTQDMTEAGDHNLIQPVPTEEEIQKMAKEAGE